MATEAVTRPAQAATPAPPRSVRLAWWFAIYGSGLVPLVVGVFKNEFNLLAPILFPLPLGFIFMPYINLLPQSWAQLSLVPMFFVGFVFYGWHLRATLNASTRSRFDFLLLVLAIVVLANQMIMWIAATSIHS